MYKLYFRSLVMEINIKHGPMAITMIDIVNNSKFIVNKYSRNTAMEYPMGVCTSNGNLPKVENFWLKDWRQWNLPLVLPHRKWQLQCLWAQIGGKIRQKANNAWRNSDNKWSYPRESKHGNFHNFLNVSMSFPVDCLWYWVFEPWKISRFSALECEFLESKQTTYSVQRCLQCALRIRRVAAFASSNWWELKRPERP